MALRKSAEDYLEAIYILKNTSGVVHSIDVANMLGFSKPSVSRAVGNLRQEGYLTMKEDGELLLTKKGTAAAEHIYERHTVLSSLLISLGVSEKTAADDACLIEHVISDETFDKIKDLYNQKQK
ncbi:metal-dependent transcriptional regulator [Ruminococcaceae bacterium OttesenSCG-928-A16]|nr:metal-dependent transcriptional regulator [Ruminococcaceae bacterium OttesenSCG-928-A16]